MERIWINWKDNCRKALSSVCALHMQDTPRKLFK